MEDITSLYGNPDILPCAMWVDGSLLQQSPVNTFNACLNFQTVIMMSG
jgi:hypothetical protein